MKFTRRRYLADPLLDVKDDKGGRDEAHGEDDADGVQQADPDLTAEAQRMAFWFGLEIARSSLEVLPDASD